MLLLCHPALLSVIALAVTVLGIKSLLGNWVLPRMIERGNALLVREVVPPLENYFADFQEWPAGTPEETMWRLQGAKNDMVGEKSADGGWLGSTPEPATEGNGKAAATEPPSVRRQRVLPTVNYLQQGNARVRSSGLTLADAWSRPLRFSFAPDGPATVTSLGPDGVLGTTDDMTATANIVARKTQPTRALFLADQQFRFFEEAKRREHARKVAEKLK